MSRKPEEIRVTKIDKLGYELCFVFGLLDTHTWPVLLPTVKAAKKIIDDYYGNATPRIPVIIQ